MATKSISPDCYVVSLLLAAAFSFTAIIADAQKLTLGIRTGASLANYIGHNDSGPERSSTVVTSQSYYDLNGTRRLGQYWEVPNPYYKTSLTKDLRTGFYAGAFLEIRWKRFSLEPGVAYVQKGIDLNFSNNTAETPYWETRYRFVRSVRTDYIAMPVVIKYYMGRRQRFYALAGIYDAYAVKTQIKEATATTYTVNIASGYGYASYTMGVQTWTKVNTRALDCGLVGGAGFNLPVASRWSLGIEARVNVGLINIKEDPDQDTYLNFSSSTKNINLEVGLRMGYALSAP